MNINILAIFMLIFTLSYIWVIIRNLKNDKTRDAYFLCKRSLGTFMLSFSLVATQIGGGMIVGIADEAYNYGFSALFYPIGQLIGLITIGYGANRLLNHANLSTNSEIFAEKYNSQTMRKFSSLISSITLFFICVAQGIAIKKLLNGLGVSDFAYFIPIWLGLVIYTSLGGLKAVIETDLFQIIFIVLGLVAIAFSIKNQPFNLDAAIDQTTGPILSVIDWLVWPLCYIFIEQDMTQRFFAAKSPKIVRRSCFIASFWILLLAFVPAVIGIMARQSAVHVKASQGVLLSFAEIALGQNFYNLTAIVMLLAIISTADSVICALSSNLVYDFNIPEREKGFFTSEVITTFIIGLLSLIAVYFLDRVITVLMFSYSICVSILFVPTVMGLLLAKPNKNSAIISMAIGALSLLLLSIFARELSYISILFSLLGYIISSFRLNETNA